MSMFMNDLQVKGELEGQHDGDTHKNQDGHSHAVLLIGLGDQVRSSDVEGHSGGDGQGVFHGSADRKHEDHPQQRGCAQDHGGEERRLPAAPAGQHQRGHGEPLGQFVQENGDEDDSAEPGGNQQAGRDGDPIEESVNAQAQQRGRAGMGVRNFVMMGFFAEVKMRCEGVFEKVDEEVSAENLKRFKKKFKKVKIWKISCLTGEGLDELKVELRERVKAAVK